MIVLIYYRILAEPDCIYLFLLYNKNWCTCDTWDYFDWLNSPNNILIYTTDKKDRLHVAGNPWSAFPPCCTVRIGGE